MMDPNKELVICLSAMFLLPFLGVVLGDLVVRRLKRRRRHFAKRTRLRRLAMPGATGFQEST